MNIKKFFRLLSIAGTFAPIVVVTIVSVSELIPLIKTNFDKFIESFQFFIFINIWGLAALYAFFYGDGVFHRQEEEEALAFQKHVEQQEELKQKRRKRRKVRTLKNVVVLSDYKALQRGKE